MNQLKNLCTLLLLLSFVMVSCSKDDEGSGDGGGGGNSNLENYFGCKIDGVDWVANGITQPTVTRAIAASDVSSKRLDFFGQNDGGQTISVVVTDYRDADQGECISNEKFYGWDHPDYGSAYSVTSAGGAIFTSDASISLAGVGITRLGTIEITKCESGKISGTFEFTVKDLTGAVVNEITEGEFFNVAYDFFE